MGVSRRLKAISLNMLAKRILVAGVLLPVGLAAIIVGGIAYNALIAFIMSLAAWEYKQLFELAGFKPASFVIVAGTLLFVVGRAINGWESAGWIITLVIFSSMTYHLVAFERGREQAGTEFAITLVGALYFGWLGGYLISMRLLPDGMWWVLLALPAIWLADSGAFLVGTQFGRHKMNRHLSPKKSWEGYFGGILFATAGTALLAAIYVPYALQSAAITPLRGALLGLCLSSFSILGDLGESMLKRQVGAKDSGTLLPGHGGIFDRIDTWLWGTAIGYYVITWFFL
jgi:phosphatidate cytidylyltransferase